MSTEKSFQLSPPAKGNSAGCRHVSQTRLRIYMPSRPCWKNHHPDRTPKSTPKHRQTHHQLPKNHWKCKILTNLYLSLKVFPTCFYTTIFNIKMFQIFWLQNTKLTLHGKVPELKRNLIWNRGVPMASRRGQIMLTVFYWMCVLPMRHATVSPMRLAIVSTRDFAMD